MKITILGPANSWHVERLAAECVAMGHEPAVVEFRRLTGFLTDRSASLEVAGRDLLDSDRVLVRHIPPGSLERIIFRMDALHRLQDAGVWLLNPPRAIENCVDKYLATARMQAAGLPIPRTAVCEDLDSALEAFDRLGGDVVVKPLFGSEGRGIVRVEDAALAYRVLRALFTIESVLYLQEFVPHRGYDVRMLVLGDRIEASMRRRSTGDFRTNVALGATGEPFEPPDEWIDLALRAARCLGAPLAGVDILPDPHGNPLVVEVNSNPGFRVLAETSGVNIARRIVEYVVAGKDSPPPQC